MIKWRYDKKLNPNGNGYLNLLLHKEGVKKSHRVHRLLVFNFEDGLTAKHVLINSNPALTFSG